MDQHAFTYNLKAVDTTSPYFFVDPDENNLGDHWNTPPSNNSGYAATYANGNSLSGTWLSFDTTTLVFSGTPLCYDGDVTKWVVALTITDYFQATCTRWITFDV